MFEVKVDPVTGGINAFPLGTVCGYFTSAGRRLTMTREFAYFDGKNIFTVPVGFTTDFNSVPRGLWNVFPPWEYPEAGVTHDWLYQHPGERSRSDIDVIHRAIMAVEGASKWLQWAAWAGIRFGGRKPWNQYRSQGLK